MKYELFASYGRLVLVAQAAGMTISRFVEEAKPLIESNYGSVVTD